MLTFSAKAPSPSTHAARKQAVRAHPVERGKDSEDDAGPPAHEIARPRAQFGRHPHHPPPQGSGEHAMTCVCVL